MLVNASKQKTSSITVLSEAVICELHVLLFSLRAGLIWPRSGKELSKFAESITACIAGSVGYHRETCFMPQQAFDLLRI